MLPEQALANATSPADMLCAQAYLRYKRALKAYNALDFDDLILLPTILFEHHPDILEKWQNQMHYLLVDEYQDTNTSQYLLVKQLVGLRGRLTVVGDDDQSIYAWRGARPENLAQLQAGLSRSEDCQAGAELPLHRAHPQGRQRPDRQ